MNIKAYYLGPEGKEFKITPQTQARECFQRNKTIQNAYRCLPLKIGSELGWQANCPINFCCNWDGRSHKDGLKIFFEDQQEKEEWGKRISSHFGEGVLTFSLFYTIKSPKKKSLYIRGPTNFYKEYCQYLDAVIETDWLNYPFTYNIKINKKDTDIFFKKDEPICSFHFIDLEEIANQNFQIENIKNKPILLDSFNTIWKHRRSMVQKKEAGLLESPHSRGYYQGGFISKDQENFIWGCPYLHFKRLNLKANNNFKLKNILNYFKIKIFFLLETYYNTILNYFYNKFFIKKILSRANQKLDSEIISMKKSE